MKIVQKVIERFSKKKDDDWYGEEMKKGLAELGKETVLFINHDSNRFSGLGGEGTRERDKAVKQYIDQAQLVLKQIDALKKSLSKFDKIKHG